MSDFKDVSLGFAEFVSQLIHDTFDAVLSSQNYQIERYDQINTQLSLSTEAFANANLEEEQIEQKIVDFFGFTPLPDMLVDTELQAFLETTFENTTNLTSLDNQNITHLTNEGIAAIREHIVELIVEEQKSKLQSLTNGTYATRLIVDSGKIVAKMELSSIYTEETKEQDKSDPAPESTQDSAMLPTRQPTKSSARDAGTARLLGMASSDILNDRINSIPIKVVSELGKPDTILIDKGMALIESKKDLNIPNLRMTARPATTQSNSEIFSTIEINFKTV